MLFLFENRANGQTGNGQAAEPEARQHLTFRLSNEREWSWPV